MNKRYFIVRRGEKEEVNTYNDLIEAASMTVAAAYDSDYKVDIRLRSGKSIQGLTETENIYLYIDSEETAA